MADWTDVTWVPVERQLPTSDDGLVVADGTKILVKVLTVGMMATGGEPEVRGFHIEAACFDDDEQHGMEMVLFWAPCTEHEAEVIYSESTPAPPPAYKDMLSVDS